MGNGNCIAHKDLNNSITLTYHPMYRRVRLLIRRFGSVHLAIQEWIRNLSGIRLEALADVLLDFSRLEDLINWLDQPEQSAKGAILVM